MGNDPDTVTEGHTIPCIAVNENGAYKSVAGVILNLSVRCIFFLISVLSLSDQSNAQY
jgi:hypothetical protein